MALKYGITTKTFEPVAAESILDSVEGMNSALQDIAQCEGCLAEAEVVMENLQKALDTISEFGVGEESLGILDSDGSLQAVLNLQAPALESLESMSEQALEALDQKWEKALEGALGDAWAKVKKFFAELWAKIKDYATRFWNWLKSLFGKNKDEAPKAEATAKATAAAGVEKQADAVVAASTPEETEKAKTELKEAVAAAPDAKKEAAAKEVAKVEAAPAPAPNTAPCTYKGAMQCAKEYAAAMKGFRSVLQAAVGSAKKNWLEIEKELKAAGGEGNLTQMSEKAFDELCKVIRGIKADAEKLSVIGIKVTSNWDVNDPGKLRLQIEDVEQKGTNTQLGWNSRKQVQEFIQAWNSVDPNVVSDSIVAKAADEMRKTGDEGTGFAASAEANAIFRKMMYAGANLALDIQKLSAKITSRLQAQFNWCKGKNALILSSEKAALNA